MLFAPPPPLPPPHQILTNNHPDLQLARSRLATVQGLLGGEKERTEARLRAALDGLQMAVGNDDASTANAMTNLALFLKGDGQHAEATELYTTVLAIRCGAVQCDLARASGGYLLFGRFSSLDQAAVWFVFCVYSPQKA